MFEDEMLPVSKGNPLALVGVLGLLKALRLCSMYTSFGYLRLINYPSVVWSCIVLIISSLVFLPLQQPWKEVNRVIANQHITLYVAGSGILQGMQVLFFFLGLKYFGPIRALLLSDHTDIIFVYIAGLFFVGTRSKMHLNRIRGLILLLCGYAVLIFFDAAPNPIGLSNADMAPFSLGLVSISQSKVGALCIIIASALEVAKKNMRRTLSQYLTGKSINSMGCIVGAVFLMPFALFSWYTATGVREVGGWFHPIESLGFTVLMFVVGEYYLDAIVKPQLKAGMSMVVSLCSATVASFILEFWVGEITFSFLTVTALFLIVAGQYLIWKGPDKGGYSDLPLQSNQGSVTREISFQLLELVKKNKDARNISIYLTLNLLFMFVELAYGLWNNSLGLISDACHMLFDCIALLIGLIALVIAEWRPSQTFSYGYGRVNVLSGFINAIFLIFIAFSVLFEALERLFETPEVDNDKLLLVSFLGLCVNLVGLFVFSHAHHAAHGHSHSHGGPSKSDLHDEEESGHGHSHGGGHGHSHGGDEEGGEDENMKGVFLHILGDTLGSVGVIISSLLIEFFAFQIADPICSFIIASFIFVSVFPLLQSSAAILLQRTPTKFAKKLPKLLQQVESISGVRGYSSPHFWSTDGSDVIGTIHIHIIRNCDQQNVLSRVKSVFMDAGASVTVQVDKEN